ncbi:MAG: SDR family NAD(P)-dependent oxidoreductase [Imperialibacter sp.]|uniref:SDR family NAD(P)-dependent oxidoreductase n=1 Tax=Imperialibacter sp. TaxID=2038411 RepID=UPI0032EF7E44
MQKVVLITGAGGNLGEAVVNEFSSLGYKVVGTAVPGRLPVGETKAEFVEADLTDEKAASDAIDKVVAKHGRLDAVIMLVGGFAMGNIEDTGGAELDKMLHLNFHTAYFTARPAFRAMAKTGGGRLVFVGARPALQASAGKDTLPYALSKSLLFNLSDILNESGKGKHITSSIVVPSIIDTPPNRKNMADADYNKWVKPEKIAKTIGFICSEEGDALRQGVYKVYGDS